MISSGLANKAHFSVVQRLRRKTQDVTVSVFSLVNSTIPSVPVLSVINYASLKVGRIFIESNTTSDLVSLWYLFLCNHLLHGS